jgi:hypothetical protein
MASGLYICLMRRMDGVGNMHFLPPEFQPTQDQEYKEGIIWTIRLFKRQLNKQSEKQEFSNMRAVIL